MTVVHLYQSRESGRDLFCRAPSWHFGHGEKTWDLAQVTCQGCLEALMFLAEDAAKRLAEVRAKEKVFDDIKQVCQDAVDRGVVPKLDLSSKKEMLLVHADGGSCHGTALSGGQCPDCGVYPDAQSVELWPRRRVKFAWNNY